MRDNPKFPSSVEIKRSIATAVRAGIEIGSIEIQPRKIIIHSKGGEETPGSLYDKWRFHQGREPQHLRHKVWCSTAEICQFAGAVANSRVNCRSSCKPKTVFQRSAS